jgi:hypothetical protein
MSIAAQSVSEAPVGAQSSGTSSKSARTPSTRQITAKADAIAQPEAR